jgi:hypothetical protein
MHRLALLVAMALLGIGLILAQNTQSTKPSSDPSNSSNPSVQPESSPAATQQNEEDRAPAPSAKPHRRRDASSQPDVPDTTIQDRQGSTTSTTGVSGQNEPPSANTKMGTAGSTPAAPEQKQPAANPQNGTSPDQQPNSSTGAETTAPHAELLQTPVARAAATHTPDPGTCMNPAALQTGVNGAPAPPPCR